MIDNDMHVLRSSTQPRARQGNDVDSYNASIYDMDNYEAASIFDEQHENTINEDSTSVSGNVLDIDDYSTTMSDIDEYSATMSDIEDQDNQYYGFEDDSDDSFVPPSQSSSLH